MGNVDALIFIDTNQYLPLYEVTKGKKLLESLKEQQDYIFVTVQVVEEVQRRKLQIAATFLTGQLEKLDVSRSGLPDYLFSISEDTIKLREKLKELKPKIMEVHKGLTNAAVQALQKISRSEDEISTALAALFSKAVTPTPEEIRRARERKERGNPPSNSRLSQNARKMAVESPEFLRFGRLCACDLSRA